MRPSSCGDGSYLSSLSGCHNIYRTGVTLTKTVMAEVEQRLTRDSHLGKWFLTICPDSALG